MEFGVRQLHTNLSSFSDHVVVLLLICSKIPWSFLLCSSDNNFDKSVWPALFESPVNVCSAEESPYLTYALEHNWKGSTKNEPWKQKAFMSICERREEITYLSSDEQQNCQTDLRTHFWLSFVIVYAHRTILAIEINGNILRLRIKYNAIIRDLTWMRRPQNFNRTLNSVDLLIWLKQLNSFRLSLSKWVADDSIQLETTHTNTSMSM